MTRTALALTAALAVAFAAGCRGDRPWVNRVEEANLPPPPPEHVLRVPPDFRIRDDGLRKEYLLYFYEDESVKEELVVVVPYDKPRDLRDRLATKEEHQRAMSLFASEWKARGDEQRVRYFNELHERATRRNSLQLDHQIDFARRALKQLEEEKFSLEVDLKSRKDTNTFAEGSEKLSLVSTATLEREIAKKDREIALASAQVAILEYKRSLLQSR